MRKTGNPSNSPVPTQRYGVRSTSAAPQRLAHLFFGRRALQLGELQGCHQE